MGIDRRLDWFQRVEEFDPNERRILLALSFKEHRWRTIDDFLALTRLDYDEVAASLTELMKQDLIMGSFDYRIEEPAFGLVERNDPMYKKRHRAAAS
jgi:hypothetical protein